MVRLEVLGDLLVLVVLTIVHVLHQMYMGCLEKRFVLMIGDYFFVGVVGGSLDVVVWGLLISNFGSSLRKKNI